MILIQPDHDLSMGLEKTLEEQGSTSAGTVKEDEDLTKTRMYNGLWFGSMLLNSSDVARIDVPAKAVVLWIESLFSTKKFAFLLSSWLHRSLAYCRLPLQCKAFAVATAISLLPCSWPI